MLPRRFSKRELRRVARKVRSDLTQQESTWPIMSSNPRASVTWSKLAVTFKCDNISNQGLTTSTNFTHLLASVPTRYVKRSRSGCPGSALSTDRAQGIRGLPLQNPAYSQQLQSDRAIKSAPSLAILGPASRSILLGWRRSDRCAVIQGIYSEYHLSDMHLTYTLDQVPLCTVMPFFSNANARQGRL